MTRTLRLSRDRLASYFDAYTKRFLRDGSPEAVDIEVTSLHLGDQPLAQGARLIGITYDADTRTLELAFESGDHRVYEPQEIWVVEEPDGALSGLEIVGRDGSQEVVDIRSVGLRQLH